MTIHNNEIPVALHRTYRVILIGIGFSLMAIGLPSDSFPPPFGSTLALDGDGDYLEIPHSSSLSPGSTITVEAWINANGQQPREAAIAGKWNDITAVARSYLLFIFTDRIQFLVSHNSGNFPRASSTTPLTPGIWQHVAGTFDGSTIRVYVDGVLEASTDTAGALAANLEPFYIGRVDAGANVSDYFNGRIEEVRVWNTARTEAQINTTMNDTLGPVYYTSADSGLVGYWRFDERVDLNQDGVADEVRDLSVNQNHGGLFGNAGLDNMGTALSETELPGSVILIHTFPNPFTAYTQIEYELPDPSDLTLIVYNINGQRVRTMVRQMQTAGVKTITWDGQDDQGRTLPAGVYLLQLSTDTFQVTRKLTLIR